MLGHLGPPHRGPQPPQGPLPPCPPTGCKKLRGGWGQDLSLNAPREHTHLRLTNSGPRHRSTARHRRHAAQHPPPPPSTGTAPRVAPLPPPVRSDFAIRSPVCTAAPAPPSPVDSVRSKSKSPHSSRSSRPAPDRNGPALRSASKGRSSAKVLTSAPCTHPLARSLIPSLAPPHSHSLAGHPCTRPFTLPQFHSRIHSLTHGLAYSLAHSLSSPLTC